MIEPVKPTPIVPLAPPSADKGRLKGPALVTLITVVTAAVAGALTQPNEGYVGKVYRDPAGYLTQCYGERQVDPSVIYSKDQCAAKLRVRMARDYAAPLIKCVPDFADPRFQWAFGAALDAAYNAGPAAVCRSPMARNFNAGKWAEGCVAFRGWYTTARGVQYPGLVRRRNEETAYCITGALPK
jgi:lysozyme